ncbi:MAG: thioredoxin domain-containing protein [bacterium]
MKDRIASAAWLSGRDPGRGRGWAIFGWAVFLVVLALVAVLGFKVFYYYRQIKSGMMIELPQYRSALSVTERSGGGLVAPPSEIESLLDSSDEPSVGPSSERALVTVVMFGDFECPFSKEAANVFRRMAVHYGDQVRFVYRDFPLRAIHPLADLAAVAAECAGEQMRYWEYFDRLYVNSPALARTDLLQYAQEVGLDEVQFERCLDSGRFTARVDGDRAMAERLGLHGTPSFFFDGRRVEGSVPEADFDRLLKAMTK